MVFASMMLSLSPAMAEGEEQATDTDISEPEEPIVYPDIKSFKISAQDVDTVTFQFSLSESLETNKHTLYLFKKGDSTIVNQIDTGATGTFIVDRPSELFDEYFISVGDKESEPLVVFPIENNDWGLTATVDKTVYSTSDTVLPKISWNIEKSLDGVKAAYLVDTSTGTVLTYNRQLTGDAYIKTFYEDFRTYRVYIADKGSSYSNLSQLKNISAISNEIKIEIDPWSITGSVDLENYSVDNDKLNFTWESNQKLGGKRSLFLIDEDSQEIQKRYYSKNLTPETGTFNIFPAYDNKLRNYKIYIADSNAKAISKSELTNIVAESNLITTDHDNWEVHLTSNNYSFYTDDETPIIVAETNQNMRKSNGYHIMTYFIDVETGMSFYVGIADNLNSNISSERIPRFYTEKEKKFKVIIAESNCSGYCKIHENDIEEIYAESNIITIKRAPWEIYTDKTVGYMNDEYTSINWHTNQALSDKGAYWNSSPHGVKENYRIYIRNLATDKVSNYGSVELYDLVTAGSFSGKYKDGQIVKYKMYLAKTDETATTFSQLEDIQAESDTITVRPTRWSVALTDVRHEDSTNGTRKYSIDFKINKNIRSSTQYSFYIANSETGKIHHGPDNTTSNGTSNFTVDQNEIGTYYAYIAEKIPGATNVSQFNDVQVISNGLFPSETLDDIYTNYHKSKRFAAGGNPSTSDCQQTCYGDPVNSFNGELFENTVDLEIDGVFPFNLSRTYSTLNKDAIGDFGYGWNFNYNMFLTGEQDSLINSQYITVSQENGSIVAFAKEIDESGEINYIAAGTVKASLRYNTDLNTFIFERKDGIQFIFNNSGILTNIKDRNNNQLTFTRNSNGKISEISNGERSINIVWNGNLISSANDGIHTVNYSYNSDHDLTEVKHSKIANSKKYNYYNDHKIHKITHPNNGVYETFYDSESRVIKQIDPRGNETNFAYSNLKTIITLPDGSKIEEVYNNRGWLLSKTLGYSTSTPSKYAYEYSSSGDLMKESYPVTSYSSKEYTYDSSGNIVFSKDASGIFRFVYNEQNLLIKTINPMGSTYTNEYDDKGNLVKTIDYEGNETKYENDSQGRLSNLQEPNHIGTNLKTQYKYNNSGLLNKTIDTLGRESELIYDSLLNISKTIDPMNYETHFEYLNNNPDLISKTIYSNGASESNIYDNAGRLIKTIGIDGNTVEYTYDLMDNILSIKDVYGTTSYTYDSNNKVVSATTPKNDVVQYEYNGLGLLTKITYSNGSVFSNSYDQAGMLISSTDGNGNTTTYRYNSSGSLWIVKDALNKQSSYNYDSLNRLTSVSSPQGSYSYKYNKNGNVLSETAPGNKTTNHKYDKNGNLISSTHPNATLSLYEYNSEGILVKSIDRTSKQKVYSYDNNDRVIQVEQHGKIQKYDYDSVDNLTSVNFNNNEKIVNYEYDLTGKVLSSQSSDGVVSNYAYDAIGNLTSRGPPGKEVSYDYNPYGEITSVNYPSGRKVDYTYNNLDQLTEVKSNNEILASYTYDANFNNISTSYENGVVETNSFDTLNRLNSINVKNENDESLYQRSLTYNANDYITNVQSSFNNTKTIDRNYTYNEAGNVLSVKNNLTNSTIRYTHDIFDNLTSIGTANKFNYEANYNLNSSTVNGINYAYTYDELGNRVSETSPDSNRNYKWNIDGTLKNINFNYSLSVDYTYDNSGLMSSKTVDGELVDEYVWDTVSSSIPTMLEDLSNEYIYGLDNTPFAQIDKSTDEIHYLFGDERNSVVLATDDAGTSVLTREYDDYGQILDEQLKSDLNPVSDVSETNTNVDEPLASDGGGEHDNPQPSDGGGDVPVVEEPVKDFTTNFSYAGEYLDADTGYYNLRARWYEPSTGSFLSEDPAFTSTDDAYGYASGNPLSYTDPLGLWSTTVDNQSNLATGAAGLVDGAIGIPAAGTLMNAISPGSVDNCSILYAGVGAAAAIGINFIPGGSVVKIGGALAKGSKGLAAVGKINKSDDEYIKIYRAVSYEESMDIRKTGKFRTGKNSVEGKYFFTKEQQAWDISKFFNSDDIFEAKIKVKDITELRLSGVESSGFYIDKNDLHKISPIRSLIDDWRM